MKSTVTSRKIPRFDTEDQERSFWAKTDSTDHIDWSKATMLEMPKLRPSLKSISLRLPEALLERIKMLANKHDVPYQSLMKIYLSDSVEREITPNPYRTLRSRTVKINKRARQKQKVLR